MKRHWVGNINNPSVNAHTWLNFFTRWSSKFVTGQTASSFQAEPIQQHNYSRYQSSEVIKTMTTTLMLMHRQRCSICMAYSYLKSKLYYEILLYLWMDCILSFVVIELNTKKHKFSCLAVVRKAYRGHRKICWAKRLWFQPHWSFHRNTYTLSWQEVLII